LCHDKYLFNTDTSADLFTDVAATLLFSHNSGTVFEFILNSYFDQLFFSTINQRGLCHHKALSVICFGLKLLDIRSAGLSAVPTWYHSFILVTSWILPTRCATKVYHFVEGDVIQAKAIEESVQKNFLCIISFNLGIILWDKWASITVAHNSRRGSDNTFSGATLDWAH